MYEANIGLLKEQPHNGTTALLRRADVVFKMRLASLVLLLPLVEVVFANDDPIPREGARMVLVTVRYRPLALARRTSAPGHDRTVENFPHKRSVAISSTTTDQSYLSVLS